MVRHPDSAAARLPGPRGPPRPSAELPRPSVPGGTQERTGHWRRGWPWDANNRTSVLSIQDPTPWLDLSGSAPIHAAPRRSAPLRDDPPRSATILPSANPGSTRPDREVVGRPGYSRCAHSSSDPRSMGTSGAASRTDRGLRRGCKSASCYPGLNLARKGGPQAAVEVGEGRLEVVRRGSANEARGCPPSRRARGSAVPDRR